MIDTTTWRGLCQGCHDSTTYFRAGVPELSHPLTGCFTSACHDHRAHGGAYKPLGTTCDSCHGYPPAPKNLAPLFGTTGNYASAYFEDYSGGGGAHLIAAHVSPFVVASDGWGPCVACHNGGRLDSTPYHRWVTPVSDHVADVHMEVDPRYRFASGLTIYTSARLLNAPLVNATGSCFNISCHMTPSKRWSTER
jgi:hypothetical protein